MAKPEVSFSFLDAGERTIQFKDGSSGNPATWLWDFGDNTTSTDKDPLKVFDSPGKFVISLKATNVDGDGEIDYELVVSVLYPSVPSIKQMIKDELPPGFVMGSMQMDNAIRSWLLYMGKVDGVEPEDYYKEWLYRPITRLLIARLVIYDKVVQTAQSGLITMGGSNAGGLKSIEVGPAKTEWYNESESWKQALQTGGSVDLLTSSICNLAFQVGVYLSMCKPPVSTYPPKVYTYKRRKWNCYGPHK